MMNEMNPAETREAAAANLEQMVVRGEAELVAERWAKAVNMGLEQFGAALRVDASDERLRVSALALATAKRAAHLRDRLMARVHQELDQLDQHIGKCVEQQRTLIVGEPSPEASQQIALIGDDLAVWRGVAAQARTMLGDVDNVSHDADVSRCGYELAKVSNTILMETMQQHVEAAECALLSAVNAYREAAAIGVKHLGDDVGEFWIPSPETAVLFGAAQ